MTSERKGVKNEIPTVLKEVRQNAEGLNLLIDVPALVRRSRQSGGPAAKRDRSPDLWPTLKG